MELGGTVVGLTSLSMKTQEFYQSLRDYYFDFLFTVSVRLKRLSVVYHIHGEDGSTTVCESGKQKYLTVSSVQTGHSPFTQTIANEPSEPRTRSA